MSLFGDPLYRWRETFLVLFQKEQRPTVDTVLTTLKRIGKFDMEEVLESENGLLESMTITSAVDLVGMEILYIEGDEVLEQVEQLATQMSADVLFPDQEGIPEQLSKADARLDILHFEQLTGSSGDADDDDELMDPGSLLAVAAGLSEIVNGVAVDPGSDTFI